jgi:Ca2+-binding EF-hand superfamily protein
MVRILRVGLLVGAAGIYVMGSPALAREEKPIPDAKQAEMLKRHPEADADKDGKLTREELRKYTAANRGEGGKGQRKAEAGKEGKKQAAEVIGRPDPAKILAAHPDADTDKDGKLGPDELRAYMKAHGAEFRADLLKEHPELDTDKDGVLSEKELREARADLGARSKLAEMVLRRFPEADTNKDRRLSPEEMQTLMQAHGDEVRADVLKRRPELDTNKDGVLTGS